MADDPIEIRCGDRYFVPCANDVESAALIYRKSIKVDGDFYRTLIDLLLKGFCLLLTCSAVRGDDEKPPKLPRQWYLVSAEWCQLCPAAKAKFLAKGWPDSNVLTPAECKDRFGIVVPHVPYEFCWPRKLQAAVVSSQPPVRFVGNPGRVSTRRRGLFGRRR